MNMYNETTLPSLTLTSSSPTNIIPSGYNQLDSFSSSMMTTLHHHFNPNQQDNSSIINLLHFSRDQQANANNNNNNNNSSITQATSKDDEYGNGFLWNMDLEENSLEHGVASNLFEVDNSNNNMVLL